VLPPRQLKKLTVRLKKAFAKVGEAYAAKDKGGDENDDGEDGC